MTQAREKCDSLVLRRDYFWMMWMPWCSMFSFFFLFRNNVTREQLDENDFRRGYGFFFESVIPKVLDHSYLQSSLLTITRHPDNGIWSTPYNWRLYRHRCQACTKTFNFVTVSFSFSQTSLVFKFNLMLIE